MSSSRGDDPFMDTNKYYFPLGTLKTAPVQSGLEVPPQRDEDAASPGLQLVPDEQKHSHQDLPGLYGSCGALQPPPVLLPSGQAVHLDEYASQGLQSVDQHYQQQYDAQQQQYPQFQHDANHADGQGYYQWPSSSQSQQQAPEHWPIPSADRGAWGLPNQQRGYHAAPSRDEYLPEAVAMHSGTYPGLQPAYYAKPDPSISGSSDMWLKNEATAVVTPTAPEWRRRPWLLWLGGVIALLVIAGSVVGGVLGSRKSQEGQAMATPSTSTLPSPGDSSTEDNVTPPKSIRMHSKLAASAWRDSTHANYTLRLFYQGTDNIMRFVENTSENKNWTGVVALDTLDHLPLENGAMAAGVYLHSDLWQWELMYIDSNSIIRCQKFDLEGKKIGIKGVKGSMNDYPIKVEPDSKIGVYFPYVISQDADNKLRYTRMLGQNASNKSAPWWVNETSMNAVGAKNTPVVLLPLAQKYTDPAGFLYRDAQTGRLAAGTNDNIDNGGDIHSDNLPWNQGARRLGDLPLVPEGSPLAGFSVGRAYDANKMNTYILYLDEKNTIQVVWQSDDTSGWQGPRTYDALGPAEPGTDITCATQGSWDASGISVSKEQNLNRCFFQEKGTGRLKEVWFDGEDWEQVGFVPLP
ncbi:hypothetical protein PG999_005942 [Apiospora kogelbergensis]|uniref:Fucose-specific lectin n=1 Tax=Apiospora kogelbergensis TaxID=1337665 RepID=A0AAW0QVS3_9PEZI